jgi:hypothetical protein
VFKALFTALCILLEIFLLVSTVDTYCIYRYGDAMKTEGTVCEQNVQVDYIGTVSSNNRYSSINNTSGP